MRASGDQEKTSCGSLQLCVGLEAGIEGATHDVAQRWQKIHTPEPGGGRDEVSEGVEDENAAATSGTERVREAMRIGGIGEVTRPPGVQISE